MKHFSSIGIAAVVFIAGCVSETGSSGVSADAARAATTTYEAVALGAVHLDEAAFRAELVDVTLVGDGWTWVIRSNGTHQSFDNDKSTTYPVGTWRFANGDYCRENGEGGPERCSEVYKIGPVYRFSDPDADGMLSGWSVTRP